MSAATELHLMDVVPPDRHGLETLLTHRTSGSRSSWVARQTAAGSRPE